MRHAGNRLKDPVQVWSRGFSTLAWLIADHLTFTFQCLRRYVWLIRYNPQSRIRSLGFISVTLFCMLKPISMLQYLLQPLSTVIVPIKMLLVNSPKLNNLWTTKGRKFSDPKIGFEILKRGCGQSLLIENKA